MDLKVTRQLPATTLVEQLGTAIDRKFPSMIAEAFSFKGDDIGAAMASMTLRGSGLYTPTSGVLIDDLADLHYFYNSQAELTADDGTTITTYGATNRLNSWAFNVNNQLLADDDYRPGSRKYMAAGDPESGALRVECLVGQQNFGAGFNARLLDQSQELAALRDQTPFKWKVELRGDPIITVGGVAYYNSLSITGWKTVYEAAEVGNRNGLVTVDINPTMLYDDAADKQIEVELINTVASYTT